MILLIKYENNCTVGSKKGDTLRFWLECPALPALSPPARPEWKANTEQCTKGMKASKSKKSPLQSRWLGAITVLWFRLSSSQMSKKECPLLETPHRQSKNSSFCRDHFCTNKRAYSHAKTIKFITVQSLKRQVWNAAFEIDTRTNFFFSVAVGGLSQKADGQSKNGHVETCVHMTVSPMILFIRPLEFWFL